MQQLKALFYTAPMLTVLNRAMGMIAAQRCLQILTLFNGAVKSLSIAMSKLVLHTDTHMYFFSSTQGAETFSAINQIKRVILIHKFRALKSFTKFVITSI